MLRMRSTKESLINQVLINNVISFLIHIFMIALIAESLEHQSYTPFHVSIKFLNGKITTFELLRKTRKNTNNTPFYSGFR